MTADLRSERRPAGAGRRGRRPPAAPLVLQGTAEELPDAAAAAGRGRPVRHHPGRRHHRRLRHRAEERRRQARRRRREDRRAGRAHRAGRGHRRRRRRQARAAVLVGEPAAVRLAGAGAAHQGPGRRDERAAARLRRRAGRGADHRRRAAAQPGADGPRDQGPGHRPLRLDRVHLGQRGAGGAREVHRARPRRPRVRRREGRLRRASRPPTPSARSASCRSWCPAGEQSSEGLLADFPPYDDVFDPIDRVLLPRADIATETLAAGLKERGWEIDDVTAYRTVRAAPPAAAVREAIKGGGFDAVCFTSSSTVRNLVGIAGKPHAKTVVAVIGPATAASARSSACASTCSRRRRPSARWSTRWPSSPRRCARRRTARASDRRRRDPGFAPGAPAALDAGAAPADGADPAGPGRLRAAGVRQGGHRPTPVPICVDARRRPAHAGLAAQGRARGGRGRHRRADAVRHPRRRRTRSARRPTPPTASSTSRCSSCGPTSATSWC